MPTKFFLLLIIISSSICGFSQNSDTIYFNKNWIKTDSKDYSFYRVALITDSIIQIKDYYSNGKLQFSGTIAQDSDQIYYGDLTSTTGIELYFDKKGRLKTMIDNDAEKYLKLLPVNYITDFLEDSVQNIYYQETYYNNGKIEECGFFTDACTPHLRLWGYDKKGSIEWINDYKYGIVDGIVEWYMDGKLYKKWEYKNNMKNGEYCVFYYKNGDLIKTGYYVDDKKNGEFTYY